MVQSKGTYKVALKGRKYVVEITNTSELTFSAKVDDKVYEVEVEPLEDEKPPKSKGNPGHPTPSTSNTPSFGPNENDFQRTNNNGNASSPFALGNIRPPMPGKVQDIKVKPGDEVEEGTVLFILEAMKMENEINSPIKGLVKEVNMSISQVVSPDDILMVIE